MIIYQYFRHVLIKIIHIDIIQVIQVILVQQNANKAYVPLIWSSKPRRKAMRYFYFLRHCTTEYNEAEIVQGSCDSPLSEQGKNQADEIGDMFSRIHFNHIFTGNQGRHVETAKRILRRNDQSKVTEIIQLPGLNEQNLGSFDKGPEQKLYDAASRLYEKRHNLIKGSTNTKELLMHHDMSMVELSSIFHEMDPSVQTETVDKVRKRSLSSLEKICQKTEENSRNLIVSSGGTLSILLNALTNDEEDGCIIPHGNCVMIRENHSHYEKMGSYEL